LWLWTAQENHTARFRYAVLFACVRRRPCFPLVCELLLKKHANGGLLLTKMAGRSEM